MRVLIAEAKARRVMTGRQWCARRACPQGAGRKFDRAVRDFAYGCPAAPRADRRPGDLPAAERERTAPACVILDALARGL